MKKFLFLGLAATILSNGVYAMQKGDKKSLDKPLYFSDTVSESVVAMNENGRVIPHNRIEVVRTIFNHGNSLMRVALGAAGLFASVYEESFVGSALSAFAMVHAALDLKTPKVRIKKYNGKMLVGESCITGEPVLLERAIAREQAEVDRLNDLSPKKSVDLATMIAEGQEAGIEGFNKEESVKITALEKLVE
jgi:hypothetical protein